MEVIRSDWKKFRKLLPLYIVTAFSLPGNRKLCTACVKTAVLCGSESEAAKADDMCRLERTDMRTGRRMINVSLIERRSGCKTKKLVNNCIC